MAKFSKLNKKLLDGLAVIPTGIQVASDISSGKSVLTSVASGVVNFAIGDIVSGLLGGPAGWAMVGIDAAALIGDLAIENGRQNAANVKRNVTGLGKVGNGRFVDNEYGATMRERSLNAIGGYQAMSRNVLGSEARRRAATISY